MNIQWVKNFALQLIPFILGAIFFTALTKSRLIGTAILLIAVTSIGYNSYRITDQLEEAQQRIIELEEDLDEAEARAEELEEGIENAKSLAFVM